MKKLDLKRVADEFEAISSDHQLFYNTETDEFDWYGDFMEYDEDDDEDEFKFNAPCWISCPNQQDLREYDIMVDFSRTVNDPHVYDLLAVALEGRGAFRRFKDTLHRVGLIDSWYKFRDDAFIEIARRWCEENDLPYEGDEPDEASEGTEDPDLEYIVIPIVENAFKGAVEVLCDALDYSRSAAEREVRLLMKKPRVTFIAFAPPKIVGIIGATPQYGDTGWELHPLAVSKAYQRKGVGSFMVKTLEREIARRGGFTLYLGSDDETGTTSLYGANLYEDTFKKLENIQNLGGHPYPFYEKLGFKIVGVLPDANGIGKPDILMAKRLK